MEQDLAKKKNQNKILPGLAVLFLILFIYSSIAHPLLEEIIELPKIPGGIAIKTIFMLFFSIFHAWHILGLKNTLIFFALTILISWGYEQVGVETGLIYGAYHYTDELGEKLGHVPIIIPIAWFMMIYPSYIIANLISNTHLTKNIPKIILIAALSAVIMTTWDLVIDPYLSGPTQNAWVWEEGGPYFGIPIHNYFGWLLTTFTIYLVYRLQENKTRWHPNITHTKFILALPVAAYGLMMIANIIPGEPPELRYIGPIVMGIPIVIAAIRLTKKRIP